MVKRLFQRFRNIIIPRAHLVTIYIELPFWVRVLDNFCVGYDDGHELTVRNNFWKLWIYEVRFDYQSLLYIGPKEFFYKDNSEKSKQIREKFLKREIPFLWQKCRTVVEINFRDKNFIQLLKEKNKFKIKKFIFQTLLPHINDFIERYRMITFDQMVYKIAPWDVPMVFFQINNEHVYQINTYDYLLWNEIPMISEYGKPKTLQPFYLIDNPEMVWTNYQSVGKWFPYEMELLDAYNFKNRGDYESAIRRAVTAIEISLDMKIKNGLMDRGMLETAADVKITNTVSWKEKKKLFKKATSKRIEDIIGDNLLGVIENARQLRHDVVHKGRIIKPSERGQVRCFIDHIRFAINSIEDNPEYAKKRDMLLLKSKIEFVDFLDQ